ncbi:MAG: GDP-mannose 4,6-dehydratase, partial [Pseudomonadota bacterium]
LCGEPLTLYGDGSQTRAFCYVSDLVDGLISLMETERHVTGPINIGNPGEFTIRELADLTIEKVGHGSVVFKPLPKDDPKQRRPDISKAECVLNWSPTVSLSDGLDRTIDYFRGAIPGVELDLAEKQVA